MSDKYKYVYKNPEDLGAKRVYLTKRQHNKLFEHRQIHWAQRYEYYLSDKKFEMQRFTSLPAMILSLVLFVPGVIFYGPANIKEILSDYKKLLNEKKYGRFSGDDIWVTSDGFSEIVDALNKNKR